jgi:hypothetical protein
VTSLRCIDPPELFCGRAWPRRAGGAGKTQADPGTAFTLSAFELLLALGDQRSKRRGATVELVRDLFGLFWIGRVRDRGFLNA